MALIKIPAFGQPAHLRKPAKLFWIRRRPPPADMGVPSSSHVRPLLQAHPARRTRPGVRRRTRAQGRPAGVNVAPGQPIITVRFNDKTGVRTLDDLHWGLIPSFAKDRKIAWRTINARAETVDTSGMLRRAFERRRCLIAVDGFFEWVRREVREEPMT